MAVLLLLVYEGPGGWGWGAAVRGPGREQVQQNLSIKDTDVLLGGGSYSESAHRNNEEPHFHVHKTNLNTGQLNRSGNSPFLICGRIHILKGTSKASDSLQVRQSLLSHLGRRKRTQGP